MEQYPKNELLFLLGNSMITITKEMRRKKVGVKRLLRLD